MAMNKKWTVLALASMLTIMSACSSNNGANNGNEAGGNKEAATNANAGGNNAAAPADTAEKPDPFGKYPETVEFTTVRPIGNNPQFPDGQSYEENDYNTFMQDQLNVKPKFVWTAPQDGFAYKKKLELAINGNDIPDIFEITGTPTDIQATLKRLVDADMIEDLTSAYEDYASPLVKDSFANQGNQVLDLFKIDGKQYAMPQQTSLENFNFVWIRDDWRKKLNLPEPKTMDDVLAIGKAFKEKDPFGGGKTVPFAMQMESEPAGLFGPGFLFDQFEAYPRLFYKDASSNIAYGGIQPGIKDALKIMSQMYKDGLLEKDFALKDTGKLQELLASGRAGIVGQAWWGVWYPLFMTLQNVPDADWKPYAIPAKTNGKINFGTTLPVGDVIVVKKGFEHPELPVKWLNVYNENRKGEFFLKLSQETFKDANDKAPILWGLTIAPGDEILNSAKQIVGAVKGEIDAATLPFTNKDAFNNIKQYIDELQDQPQAPSKNMLQWQNTRSWYDAMGGASGYELNVVYSAFDGQTPTMEKKLTALNDLQMKAYHSIIMKSTDIDADFDKFVSDWKAQGGDQIITEITEALANK
ncbi:hypothetical protein [Paenibacillus sacheonensis]|uniref:Aldouronate transport system substrate-binding protein n=1 Tax=Paenibacillus sacheonensis TaxID=742054 RepID=A0A7X4YQX9_9BACL|nr:hypothetical protein [Paenibacillus sacheonensis]MBM7567173.1 putative aldouronate transport system substrate-binding protein [Paenibacillus sacheonensis]NBC70902.1 hypothetical protein [Paenibacillus sacheonensis]